MEIFLDTANLDEIKSAFDLGLISGVTTNPSLMARAGHRDYKAVTREICSIVQDRISAEVVNVTSAETMVAEAQEIATWSPHAVVKIPVTTEGLKAIGFIAEQEVDPHRLCQGCPWLGKCATDIATARELVATWGIRVNATLVFSANQALFAANAGASFVSPFVGRLDEIGQDGIALVKDIVTIFETYGIDTQIISAALRHPMHITQSALAGADIATVSYEVLMKSLRHPLTDVGLERFLADWAKVTDH